MTKRLALLMMGLCVLQLSWANSPLVQSYIMKYKDIAIVEMHRTKIPASIKLAQGLLESDWGRSELATQANNHFGIKCGRTWNGDQFYKKDDDTDQEGNLVESCFRSFQSPEESFFAHSEFLTDPSKRNRYGFLFDYGTDYEQWAHGLRKAGYATDPNYPQKLIRIIEQYRLYEYDEMPVNPEILASASAPKYSAEKQNTQSPTRVKKLYAKIDAAPVQRRYAQILINGLRAVLPAGGEKVETFAALHGMDASELIANNEYLAYPDDILLPEVPIFLERKKRDYHGKEAYHVVREGESMSMLAQQYGIRLSNLYSKNRMSKNAEPLVGEKIYLQKTVSHADRPKTRRISHKEEDQFLFQPTDKK